MSRESELKEKLKEWIIKNSRSEKVNEINNATKILEEKIVTSLQIMELIVYLEQLTGRPVNPDQLKPGAFSSIEHIYDVFYEGK